MKIDFPFVWARDHVTVQSVLVDERDAERVDSPAGLDVLCLLHGARDRPDRLAVHLARQHHDDRHPRLLPGDLISPVSSSFSPFIPPVASRHFLSKIKSSNRLVSSQLASGHQSLQLCPGSK